MPIMIPSVIPHDASDSEKAIFETLKVTAECRHWEILHGASAGTHQFHFVILSSSDCCVICLDVAANYDYQFENGQWRSRATGNPITSPLNRAEDSKETIRKCFERTHFHDGSPLSLGFAVAFTDGTEMEDWLLPEHLRPVAGSRKLQSLGLRTGDGREGLDALHPNTLGLILGQYAASLNQVESYEESKTAQLMLNELRTELVTTGDTITRIATIFHDNLETHDPQLLRLTDDQHKVLELVGCQPPSVNATPEGPEPRCVVDGAAGTGKTVLAIEIARQRCEAGETVGLLCSNPYLSRRFTSWAKSLPNGGKIMAGTPATLPSWILAENEHLAAKHQQRLDNPSDRRDDSPGLEASLKLGYLHKGWDQFISETIEDLNTLGQGPVFDYLIVDEAQNLCDEMFLRLQNALLKDGLENGRWIMFGDFTHQNIVSPEIGQNGKKALSKFGNLNRKDAWKDVVLNTNCRNTNEIAEKTLKLVEIESPPIPMLGVHGPHVEIAFFKSQQELEEMLDDLIQDWEDRRFQSRQIILLSSGTGSEFDTSRTYAGWRLLNIAKDTSSGEDRTLRYSDVYDFQGLESDLAILVLPKTENMVALAGGLTLPRDKHLGRVLYTGMSRAKAMLVIVADERWRGILERREFLFDTLKDLEKRGEG